MAQYDKAEGPGRTTGEAAALAGSTAKAADETTSGVTTPGVTGVTTSGVHKVSGGGASAGGASAGGSATVDVAAIFDATREALEAHLRRLGVPAADVEEVVQRTMVCVLRWVHKHRVAPDDPKAFVCKLAERRARDLERERRRHPLVPDNAVAETIAAPESGNDPERRLLRAERVCLLHDALAELPEIDAAVVRKVRLKGMSYAEAGEELGLSADAVDARLRRALPKLEELIRGEGGGK
jgi:RNA polymerase sigma factor (sigma-70 family)